MAPVRDLYARQPPGEPWDRRVFPERAQPFDSSEPDRHGGDELQGGPASRLFRRAGRLVLVRSAVGRAAPRGRTEAIHRGADEAARSVRTARRGGDLAPPP